MFAKVIVDVPAKQTNRAFDYIVPKSLEPWVEVGSRVGVSFGPRKIQGFVVALLPESDLDPAKMKEIEQVLDAEPPLNQELVELSGWMSEQYICHQITALQAMIPGALKAKYERYITLSEEDIAKELVLTSEEVGILDYIRAKGGVELEALLHHFGEHGAIIKQWIQKGLLSEQQRIKDQAGVKKVLTVFPPRDAASLQTALAELPRNAARQKQLLEYFMEHAEPFN